MDETKNAGSATVSGEPGCEKSKGARMIRKVLWKQNHARYFQRLRTKIPNEEHKREDGLD